MVTLLSHVGQLVWPAAAAAAPAAPCSITLIAKGHYTGITTYLDTTSQTLFGASFVASYYMVSK